jgi:hypothetical protein
MNRRRFVVVSANKPGWKGIDLIRGSGHWVASFGEAVFYDHIGQARAVAHNLKAADECHEEPAVHAVEVRIDVVDLGKVEFGKLD